MDLISQHYALIFVLIISCIALIYAAPLPKNPRQVNISQKPDGTIVASFAASQAFNNGYPGGGENDFAFSQSFEIGRNGAASSSSSAFNSDIGGNRMSFANSQSQNSRQDPFGFSNSAANAASNSFSNPFFSGSNAQANAFGSQFGIPG